MLDRKLVIVPASHFHIRWLPSGKLDWERHYTRDNAEKAAAQLARSNEEHVIEQFDDACRQCNGLPTL